MSVKMAFFRVCGVLAAVALAAVLGGCWEYKGVETLPDEGVFPPENVELGAVTDARDGKKYNTVKIGNQTWMAQNLNFAAGNSWCYEDEDSNCAKYGRLYTWNAAKSACPSGWQLPNRAEWDNLMKAVGGERERIGADYHYEGAGKMLKSKSGWEEDDEGNSGDGTDDYGFSAIPGGGRSSSNGSFDRIDDDGYWWSAMKGSGGNAYYRSMGSSDYVFEFTTDVRTGFSVRCVMGHGDAKKEKDNASESRQKNTPSNVEAGPPLNDARDGKTYRTVKIGDYTWMGANLDHQTSDSWCYDNDSSNCAKYGRLYTWNAAKSACPSGWHLPGRAEWDNLMNAVGRQRKIINSADSTFLYTGAGKKLKSKSGWKEDDYGDSGNGTDVYGFSAMPGGIRDEDGGFGAAGNYGNFWSAMEGSDGNAYLWLMNYGNNGVLESSVDVQGGFSARCVKN